MNKVVVNYLWQNVAHLRGIWKMLSKLFWYFSQNYLAALRPSYSANIMVQIFRVYCELIYTYLHGSNSEQNLSFLLFCCPKASFGPLLRRQPHSLDVHHSVFPYLTWRSPETLFWGWVPKPSRVPSLN